MEIVELGNVKKIVAKDGYVFRIKGDNYIEQFTNEVGDVVPAYFPLCYESIIVSKDYTVEDFERDYEELLLSNYPWKLNEINAEAVGILWEDALLNGLK